MSASTIPLPLTGRFLLLLVAAYMLPGLLGHDPWKTEDAIGFGIVNDMLTRGSWLTPHLAAEPFYEDGPLFYWIAAAAAKTLSLVMAPHNGAQIGRASCRERVYSSV